MTRFVLVILVVKLHSLLSWYVTSHPGQLSLVTSTWWEMSTGQGQSHCDSVLFNRLQIGHCCLTNSYLLSLIQWILHR